MKDLTISIIIANKIKYGDDIIWPMYNDNRLHASNTKEGWGKKGWNLFKELVEQENNNHKDYENTLAEDEDIDLNRINRFHYELI